MQMCPTRVFASGTASIEECLAPVLLLLIFSILVAGCSATGSEPEVEAPAAPTGLEATSQNGAIGLSWNAVGEADTYRVYRGTSSGVEASGSPLETGISPAGYTDETAENGTTYYYVVTAAAEEGDKSAESNPSGEVEKTPFADPPDRP